MYYYKEEAPYDRATAYDRYVDSNYYNLDYEDDEFTEDEIREIEENKEKANKIIETILDNYTYFDEWTGSFYLRNYPAFGFEEAANYYYIEGLEGDIRDIITAHAGDNHLCLGTCEITSFAAELEVLEQLLDICHALDEVLVLDFDRYSSLIEEAEGEAFRYEMEDIYHNMPWWDADRAYALCDFETWEGWAEIVNKREVVKTLEREWQERLNREYLERYGLAE